MPPQIGGALVDGHGDLLGADGDKPAGKVVVVLEQEADRDKEEVDVVEDEGFLLGVLVTALEEGDRVLAPMAEGVEVV